MEIESSSEPAPAPPLGHADGRLLERSDRADDTVAGSWVDRMSSVEINQAFALHRADAALAGGTSPAARSSTSDATQLGHADGRLLERSDRADAPPEAVAHAGEAAMEAHAIFVPHSPHTPPAHPVSERPWSAPRTRGVDPSPPHGAHAPAVASPPSQKEVEKISLLPPPSQEDVAAGVGDHDRAGGEGGTAAGERGGAVVCGATGADAPPSLSLLLIN